MTALHYYNEHNPYRAAVLRERMDEGMLPKGVVDERDIEVVPDEDFLGYTQIHLFAGIGGFPLGLRLAGFPEDRRIVSGGFPCQDISNAGKRAGITGSRSRLWREMVRCVRVVRPELVFVENVAALLGRGMGVVLGDLAEIGYDAIGDCLSAADVGAPHLRRRIWIVAHDARARIGKLPRTIPREWGPPTNVRSCGQAMADANGGRCESGNAEVRSIPVADSRSATLERAAESRRERCNWKPEPNVGRVDHGIPKRVDRLAALGDAIVPQCAAEAVKRLVR